MVDPIGIKAGTVIDRGSVPVVAAASVDPVKPVDKQTNTVETTASSLSQSMAAQPPVDTDRVARIRKAIQDGRFPLVPSTIADRLLALKLDWTGNDKA